MRTHTHVKHARARAHYMHAGTSLYLLNKHTPNINFLTRSARCFAVIKQKTGLTSRTFSRTIFTLVQHIVLKKIIALNRNSAK